MQRKNFSFLPIFVIFFVVLISQNILAAGWKTVEVGNSWETDVPDDVKQLESGAKPVFMSQDGNVIAILEHQATQESCKRFLDATKKQTINTLKDAVQRELMQLTVIPVNISGRDGLISEGGTRTPAEVKAGRPMHPIRILMVCASNNDLITVTLTMRQGEMTNQLRDVQRRMGESIRPKKARAKNFFGLKDTSTCPLHIKNCSPQNLCKRCDSSCGYCQNLNHARCGSNDCMTCKDGKRLQQLYDDGTGRCI